MSKQF